MMILLSCNESTLDILADVGLCDCNLIDIPMDSLAKLDNEKDCLINIQI